MNPILQIVADNQALFDALKNTIIDEFEIGETVLDSDHDDVKLGQMFRARLIGVRRVEDAFKRIARLKSPPEKVEGVNRAR